MRLAALALLALGCSVVPCREAVHTLRVDERFSDDEFAAVQRGAGWWAEVDPMFAMDLQRGPVVLGTPGTLAMPTREVPERIRGRYWPTCAMAVWAGGLTGDEVFRVTVHEIGHFYGLSHVDHGLMTSNSARSEMCLTGAEAATLCGINGCSPDKLGNRCE